MPHNWSYIPLILALVTVTLSMVAGFWRYRDGGRRISSAALAVTFLIYLAGVGRLAALSEPGAGLAWSRILLGVAGPAVLAAHFFVLALGRADPAGAVRRHRLSLIVQAIVTLAFLGLIARPDFVVGYSFREGAYSIELGPVGRLYLAFLLGGVALVGFRFESTLRGSTRPQRQRLQWMALGIFGVVGYFIYFMTEGAFNGMLGREALIASAVPLGLAGALTTLTHVRGGLEEAGVVVDRHVVYRSLTGLFVVGYLGLVFVFGKLAEMLGLKPGIISAATIIFSSTIGLAAFLLSRSFRHRLRRLVERSFYSNRLDYRSWWLRASHELISGVGVSELVARSVQLLEDLFEARPVSIYLSRREGDPFRCMTADGSEVEDVEVGEPIVATLETTAAPIRLPERRQRASRPELLPLMVENEALLEASRARVVAPLRTAERLVGFVLLGPRPGQTGYSAEDLALLETLTLQLAGSVRGAWLSEDLGAAREMEVFSQWANVVVHDLKNFVSPLRLFVQNARRHIHNPEFQAQAIDDIQSVAEKMDREIHRLTVLRHGEEVVPAPTDLEWVLESALARAGLDARPGFEVHRRFSGLPKVTADAQLLDRVFTNLLTNAVEAMPEGGVLTLETEDVREPLNGRRWAVARVRDTGVGMSPAFLRHRLFQPFATTKKKGWGLGLYQCRSIVEAHGGTLTASSRPGLGSEFRLALPLTVTAVRPEPRVTERVWSGLRRPPK